MSQVRSYEGLQHPGDIIFVPGDWWHGVLNLQDCVAVTQNYCTMLAVGKRWCYLRESNMAGKLTTADSPR